MSRFKFINIVDTLFISSVTFLIIFAWLQFFLKNIVLSLFLSVILAISLLMLLHILRSRKCASKTAIINKNMAFAKAKIALQTMSTAKFNLLIKKMLKPKTVKAQGGDIYFLNNNQEYLLTTFFSAELNDIKLLEIIKIKNLDNIIIVCSSYTKDAKVISKSFNNKNITLINIEDFYEMLCNKNMAIDTSNINLDRAKITLKDILKGFISRDKSKGYFISGLIVLFTSIIIPYRLYYVIFSSILLVLSLICKIKPKKSVDKSLFEK